MNFEHIYKEASKARLTSAMAGLIPSFILSERLKESYENTSTDFLKNMLNDIRDSDLSISDISIKYGLKINIINSSNDIISSYYDISNKKIIITIPEYMLLFIKVATDEELEKIYIDLATSFSHEDIHKQQFSKRNSNFNYKSLNKNIFDAEYNKEYFNQQIEADAYGVQAAKEIIELYNKETKEQVYNRIYTGNIEGVSRAILNVYRDPQINKNSKKKFFRALFDYIDDYYNK